MRSYHCRYLTCSHARCQLESAQSWSGWTGRNSSPMIYLDPRGSTGAWRAPGTSRPGCRRPGPGPYRPRSPGGGGPSRSRTPGRGGTAARRSPADGGWSVDLSQKQKMENMKLCNYTLHRRLMCYQPCIIPWTQSCVAVEGILQYELRERPTPPESGNETDKSVIKCQSLQSCLFFCRIIHRLQER